MGESWVGVKVWVRVGEGVRECTGVCVRVGGCAGSSERRVRVGWC